MQLSETVKLYLTKEQKTLVMKTMEEYIRTVNALTALAVSGISIAKYTTADVDTDLPSALTNQCIRDAKSIVKKHYKNCHKTVLINRKRALKTTAPKLPVLRKPCCYINNQNFKVNGNSLEFPVMVNGKSKRIAVAAKMTDAQKDVFAGAKLGTMRIVVKNNAIVAQIVYEVAEPAVYGDGNIMGVDLGIKCPAVSYCSDGSIKFYGNGRQNKYMRRHYAYLRKKLQKAKHIKAVKRINDKEQRIMRDTDHKVSRAIIETAVSKNVTVIKMEQLANIRFSARTSRKNNHSLHNWSFYRLAQFIEYKAKLAGIAVEYVNPAYTSQCCPVCGTKHHAKDRKFDCGCGYKNHRDVVGAINIHNSTEFVGNRQTA